MVSDTAFLDVLRTRRLVAIIRSNDPAAAARAGLCLIECGVACLEVSLSGVDALRAIDDIATRASADAIVGAGTVLRAEDVSRAKDAGAQFVVTPGASPASVAAVEMGVPCIGGALTPSEVIVARDACAAVKLFPASFGGVAYLRALREPLPDVAFVPVGGIDAALAAEYLDAGATAVGAGRPLLGDAAHGGELSALRSRARTFLDATA